MKHDQQLLPKLGSWYAVLLLMAGLTTSGCLAQSADSLGRGPVQLRLAYLGSLLYPGVRIGVDIPVKRIDRTKYNGSGQVRLIRKERFLAVSVGGYHHVAFHDNLYSTVEWLRRRTGNGGFFTEFSSGVGYSRIFLGGTTYRVDATGKVSAQPGAGYNYALVTAGVGLGYDFARRRNRPMAIFTKFSGLFMLPYNNFIYARPTLEAGVSYQL